MAPYENPITDIMSDSIVKKSSLASPMSVNASAILAQDQRHTIRLLATSTSCLSIAAALLALYWFCIMRRNFRRDLVLLLIIGDFIKNMVFMLFSAVTFTHGQVKTGSKFCTSTGYLLQWSIDSCDIAISPMSLHMCLQIFPPSYVLLGSDGLYNIRRWVVAAWVVIPTLMTSLAFVNPENAFMATGTFCTLPVRPIWYRLALSWIPRYLIWLFIMGVAVRIYVHVGKEFKVFGQLQHGSSSPPTSDEPSLNTEKGVNMTDRTHRWTMTRDGASEDEGIHEVEDTNTQGSSNQSRQSWSLLYPHWQPQNLPSSQEGGIPSSHRGIRQIAPGITAEDFASHPLYDFNQHRGSITTVESVKSSNTQSKGYTPTSSTLPSTSETNNQKQSQGSPQTPATSHMLPVGRHRAIQRQLRLLFIYPVVYMFMWVIPFIVHCLNYSDHFAQHPIFVLSALGVFCQTFMGFTDVAIFCWREEPWRHIPGSDGSFVGSFRFWRFCSRRDRDARRVSHAPRPTPSAGTGAAKSEYGGEDRSGSKAGLIDRKPTNTWGRRTSRTPRTRTMPHLRSHSGGSDRRQLELQRAQERLALERQDWAKKQQVLQAKRASAISMHSIAAGTSSRPPSLRKEWWDGVLDDEDTGYRIKEEREEDM